MVITLLLLPGALATGVGDVGTGMFDICKNVCEFIRVVKRSDKSNISIYSQLRKFQNSPVFCLPACRKTWLR